MVEARGTVRNRIERSEAMGSIIKRFDRPLSNRKNAAPPAQPVKSTPEHDVKSLHDSVAATLRMFRGTIKKRPNYRRSKKNMQARERSAFRAKIDTKTRKSSRVSSRERKSQNDSRRRRIFWRGPDASKQVDGDFTVRLASVLRKAGITDRAIRRSVKRFPSINSQRPLKHPMLSPAGRFSRLP